MPELDLGPVAKATTDGEPKALRLGDETWRLPDFMPLECIFALRRGDLEAFLRALLGDEPPRDEDGEPSGRSPYSAFMALRPTSEHMSKVINGIETLYGVDAGESEASATPSNGTGAPSRPTSSMSTA